MADNEDFVLRVSAKSDATSLGSAISHAVYDSQRVVLRAVGAGAVNQGVKAIAIASNFVALRALTLYTRIGWETITMGDGKEVSAILMRIEAR